MSPEQQPTLETKRLVLRPFSLEDAKKVQQLAGDRRIAEMMLTIPHPYEDGMAEEWIPTLAEKFASGEMVDFAITLREGGTLVGAVGLTINKQHEKAELGYWIGADYWGQGYCTEATGAMVRFGFDYLQLNRVQGHHLTKNPASGRVMLKVGLLYEGRAPQAVKKGDRFEDIALYGIIRSDWNG